MLLLDRLTAIEPDFASLRAERWLDPDDSVFAGHFPGEPVYPGVLLVEMIGQAALCLYGMRQRQAGQGPQQQIRATRIHHAAFHAAALPGAKLDIHAHIAEDRGITTVFAGQVWSAETLCATAVGECLNVSG
jgi:3-hydroxymyristoyl/3-hydroxydecanoyl-(acyl carrier protein) dehydratase